MIDWLVSALHEPKNRGKRQVWQDFSCQILPEEWYAADPLAGEEYFPEDFSVHREEKLTREEIVEPDSGTVVRMQAYLVRRYRPSLEVCLSMWENYEVEGRLGGYSQVSFEPVLCEMEKLYSELFETAESELIRWKKELLHFGREQNRQLPKVFLFSADLL